MIHWAWLILSFFSGAYAVIFAGFIIYYGIVKEIREDERNQK